MDTSGMRAGRFDEVAWVASTGSTNDDLAELARQHSNVPRVLTTDLQTAGRGRRDRRWDMEPGGGLLISFYVPWSSIDTAHLLATALGVAAVDAAAAVGRDVGLKWPNDLVTESGSKLGGMLGTTVHVDGSFVGVVVGLGCNVSWPPDTQPGLENATSLDRLGAVAVDRVEFATELVRRFDTALTSITAGGAAALHDRYRSRCFTIGSAVRVEQGGSAFVSGIATDIDPSGALLVEVDGVQRRIDAGDVVHLRPA
jgi:BirA family biotin operon repressor/biotin-[acetyl-CoA-carboxylase] ligase